MWEVSALGVGGAELQDKGMLDRFVEPTEGHSVCHRQRARWPHARERGQAGLGALPAPWKPLGET